jgi:two-component system CheB/CheR fusion protein
LRIFQEQFLTIAVHELRTPLTSLYGNMQLHLRGLGRGEATETLQRTGKAALEQVQRLRSLVERVTDVTRLRIGRLNLTLAPLDLVAVARSVVAEMQETTEPLIALEVPDSPVQVNGDSGRLGDVLVNLLANAVKYASSSPEIHVRVREGSDGTAELEVEDHGPGIAVADQSRLFTQFFQAERFIDSANGGLGLGLFIAHEIVTAHGGSIAVRSVEGEGSRFTVQLPLLNALDSN